MAFAGMIPQRMFEDSTRDHENHHQNLKQHHTGKSLTIKLIQSWISGTAQAFNNGDVPQPHLILYIRVNL